MKVSVKSLMPGQLTELLMESDKKHFQKQIDRMVQRNIDLLGPETLYGFVFGTSVYKHSACTGHPNQSLHESLRPDMTLLAKHRDRVKNDAFLITQMISVLIMNARTVEEALAELPDVMMDFLPVAWQDLPIKRHPARSIQSDSNMMIAYERILNLMHTYAGMRYMT
jgi:hypothetical protein